jgi:hypothetical protein
MLLSQLYSELKGMKGLSGCCTLILKYDDCEEIAKWQLWQAEFSNTSMNILLYEYAYWERKYLPNKECKIYV